MIITHLMGGLGNQMFQYAFGRYLAIKNNTELKLDTSFLENTAYKPDFTFRNFELGVFDIKAELANEKELEKFRKPKNFFRKLVFKSACKLHNRKIIQYEELPFKESIKKLRANIFIKGYWQSEKYFKEIEEVLQDDFKIVKDPPATQQVLLNDIVNSNSVSIHVRRGDYVTNPINNKLLGTCSIEYYEAAIKYIGNVVKDPAFYIFSDDLDWVKDNIRLYYPHTFVEGKPHAAYEDLRLMRACKNNIIANSSFSWWGAWLNTNKEKHVIAPSVWFVSGYDTRDVVPKNWIRL